MVLNIFSGMIPIIEQTEIDRLPAELKDYLQKTMGELLKTTPEDRKIIIGLSGGSMPNLLAPIIAEMEQLNGDRIRFFAVDERMVPLEDAESNTGIYLKKLPVEFRDRFAPITHIDNAPMSADEYEKQLRSWNPEMSTDGWPMFDLIFLGMGDDGHTCSLFPNHALLKVTDGWITSLDDSPKPPPIRITVTLPVLNNARHVAFIVTGESKASVLKEILQDDNRQYPAAMVRPIFGQLHWFLDRSAASKL